MSRTSEHVLSLAASDPALAQLCDAIIERLQSGDDVDIASLALQHPEYAEQLQRLVPAFEALVDLGATAARQPLPANPKHGVTDLAPRVLGDYRIVREIGRGGMGVVYEAEQRSLNRRVALKVLPMAAAMDARQLQRFQVEAQAAACLHHPHIVPVHGVGCERGVHYYAMQLIDGQSLAAMIVELRRLDGLDPPAAAPDLAAIPTTTLAARLLSGVAAGRPGEAVSDAPTVSLPSPLVGEGGPKGRMRGIPDRQKPQAKSPSSTSTRNREYIRSAARLALEAALALDHAHARGILHRDIKPGNLLIDAEGRLWVTDFGLAQVRGDDRLTLTGDVLGTLRYMSPEQALGLRVVVDGRTDVYSLGVTLYELLTLRPAVDGRDRAEILRRIADGEPSSLRMANPAVPSDLETIVLKATAKDPAARYATAQELAGDLRSFLEHRPIRARRPGPLERAAKWSRRHRAVVTTAALLLLLGTAISLWQAARARQAAVEARERADELKQVVEYLTRDVFIASGRVKVGPRSVRLGELLDRADATIGERFRRRPLAEAAVRMALAESFLQQTEFGRADQNAARAVELRERYQGPEHAQSLEALALRSWTLSKLPTDAAEITSRRALASIRHVMGPSHPYALFAQSRLALTVGSLGRLGEAEELAAQSAGRAVRVLGPEHDTTLHAQQALGLIVQMQGDMPRAEALFRHNLAGWERAHGATNDGAVVALTHLAQVVLAQSVRVPGRTEEARSLLMEAVNRFAQVYGLPHIRTSSAIYRLFDLLKEQRDYPAIRDLCQGWIHELLALPNGLDQNDRQRHKFRLIQLVMYLVALPEEVPLDGELAVSAAERCIEQGNDAEDNNWTRLSLVHLRLGHLEQAEWALRESMKRHEGDCFDSMTWALILARRGEMSEAREWFGRAAREKGRRGQPGLGYDQVRDEVAAMLGVNDASAEVLSRP